PQSCLPSFIPLNCIAPGALLNRYAQLLDAVPRRIVQHNLWTVKSNRIVIQERTIELGRVIALQPQGLIGNERETCAVTFTKSISSVSGKLRKDSIGCHDVDPFLFCAT